MAMQRKRRRRSSGNNGTNNNPNKHFDSNGPDVRIRGSAQQISERYLQYARDAQTSGDRIKAEMLFQHAEHYTRIVAALEKQKDKDRERTGRSNRDSVRPAGQAQRAGEEASDTGDNADNNPPFVVPGPDQPAEENPHTNPVVQGFKPTDPQTGDNADKPSG